MSTITGLTAAVAARKDSLTNLRERLEVLLAPLPIGVALADDEGEMCRVRRICTGASQWTNRTWDVTIYGKGLVTADDKIVCEDLDRSYFDGHNMHYHKDEGFFLGRDSAGSQLSWLSGRETRAIAARLPRAIERYMAECEAERVANDAAASA